MLSWSIIRVPMSDLASVFAMQVTADYEIANCENDPSSDSSLKTM